jgi:hypothetical protein
VSEFEFLSVFISIVIGLAVTHLLQGLGQAVHERDRIPVDPLLTVWTLSVLIILVLNWWVFFAWETFDGWSFDVFLLLILWAISLYMLAVVLYPARFRDGDSYRELFERNRRWFFGTFIVFILLDVGQTAARGKLFHPPIYLPYVLHYALFSAVGIAVADTRYQRFFAWYTLVSVLMWSLGVRRLLGA